MRTLVFLFLFGFSLSTQAQVKIVYLQPFFYATSGTSWDETYVFVHTENVGTPSSREVIAYVNGIPNILPLIGSYRDHSAWGGWVPGSDVHVAAYFHSDAGSYADPSDQSTYHVKAWDFTGGEAGYVQDGGVGLIEAQKGFGFAGGTMGSKISGQLVVNNGSGTGLAGVLVYSSGGTLLKYVPATVTYTGSTLTGGALDLSFWSFNSVVNYAGNLLLVAVYTDGTSFVQDDCFGYDYYLSTVGYSHIY